MKKRIVLPLFICLIVMILISVINMKTVYLGSYTKVISIGSFSFKYNSNRKVVLKNVNIYKNGNKIKGYIKSQSSNNGYEYYAVSSSNNKLDIDYLVASGSMAKIDVIDFETSEINNEALVRINGLLGTNLLLDSVLNYGSLSYDIDNDITSEEVFYVVYFEDDLIVTRVFINDNDQVINIVNEESDLDNGTSYNLACLIDFNNDKNYEVVVSKVDGDSQPTYYNVYKYNDGSIKEIK